MAGYGQVNIFADTDRKEAKVNERINLVITVEANGDDLMQESNLMLPDLSKFNMMGTGSERNTYLDKGIRITQQVFLIALEPKQSGTLKIGSALMRFNGKVYKSEPFEISVKDGPIQEPAIAKSEAVYLDMHVNERQVYENQPTLVILKVFASSVSQLSQVSNINMPQQDDVEVRMINFGNSDIEERKGKKASQVVAVAMLIPEKSGKVTVKPATATYNNGSKETKLISNKVDLNVKALPEGAPQNFRNAVGNYHINLERVENSLPIEVNKPLNVVLRVEGEGNINENQLPQVLNAETYTLYKSKVVNHLRNLRTGTKGEVLLNYVVIPKVSGDITVNSASFSFFNPRLKKYINLGGETLPIHVMTSAEIADAKTTLEKVNEYSNTVLETVSSPIVPVNSFKAPVKHQLNWTTIFTNYSLIAAFLMFFGVVAWITRKYFADRKPAMAPLGSVNETENQIRESRYYDYEAALVYLQKLNTENRHQEFFKNFDDFTSEVEGFVKKKFHSDVKTYVENQYGSSMAERYRTLYRQLQVEKYAPVHTKEHLDELINTARNFYSSIL